MSDEELVAKALSLLEYATRPHDREGNVEPEYILHPKLLRKAQALQFVFTTKTGLVVGVSKGSGFTITRLRTFQDGTASWSAPCFLTAGSISLGATIGKHEASSLSLVLSDKAAELLKTRGSTSAAVAADANLTLSENWHSGGVSFDSLTLEDVVSIGLADGLLVDLSAAVGSLKVSTEHNQAAYGQGVETADILGAGTKPVSAPPAFGELYDKLNEIITAGK